MWTKVFCVYFDEFVVRGNGFTHRYFATHIHQMIMIKNGVLAAECYRWTHPFLCHAHQMWIFPTQKRIFHWNEVQSDLVVFIAFLPHPRNHRFNWLTRGEATMTITKCPKNGISLFYRNHFFFFVTQLFCMCAVYDLNDSAHVFGCSIVHRIGAAISFQQRQYCVDDNNRKTIITSWKEFMQ